MLFLGKSFYCYFCFFQKNILKVKLITDENTHKKWKSWVLCTRRMRIARLPTVHVLVATTRCQYWGGGWGRSSSEQGRQWWGGGSVPGSDVRGREGVVVVHLQVWCLGGRYPAIWPIPLSHDACDVSCPLEQTYACENITFQQLR